MMDRQTLVTIALLRDVAAAADRALSHGSTVADTDRLADALDRLAEHDRKANQ
jgi:hypothetical protein